MKKLLFLIFSCLLFFSSYCQTAEEFYHRGKAKDSLQDYRGAIADYSKVIELNPKLESAYFQRGLAKYELKDYQEAISDYSKAIEIDSNCVEAYMNRGVAKSKLNNWDAIEDYGKAIKINPKYADAYYNRAASKYELKDYQGAIEDYSKVIELNPTHTGVYCNRGLVKYNLKDYHGAIEDFNKALEINPTDSEAYSFRENAKNILHQKKNETLILVFKILGGIILIIGIAFIVKKAIKFIRTNKRSISTALSNLLAVIIITGVIWGGLYMCTLTPWRYVSPGIPSFGGGSVRVVKSSVESNYMGMHGCFAVYCTVQNVGGYLINGASFSAIFYDRNGRVVGTALGSCMNLPSGATRIVTLMGMDIYNSDSYIVQADAVF